MTKKKNLIQVSNGERYVKIDLDDMILIEKKSDGPFQGIPIYSESKKKTTKK